MHGQHLVHLVDFRIALGEPPDLVHHLAVGALADEQPLGLERQPHRGAAEDQADDDRCRGVEQRIAGELVERDAGEGHHQAGDRRAVLEQHREHRRILAALHRFDHAALAARAAELAIGREPRRAFEEQRDREHHIIDVRVLDLGRVAQMADALVERKPGAGREHQQRDDEAPEIDLLAVAERKARVGRPGGALHAVEQQRLIAAVDQRARPARDDDDR